MTMRIELVAGGALSNKKVKRRMSEALNLTSFYRCLTPYCGVARRRPPPVQRTSTEPRR